ncbi:MAG: HAMP domain-containing histidine kinase [Halobacteriales archaeon]|nr:HAMP domain-containing histidine kinase [Halobacteriales archaeon]
MSGATWSEEDEKHLLSVMAHEVNNAVTPIRAHAAILGQAPLLDEGASRSVAAIQRLADRLAGLAADMLDTSRMHSGRLRVAWAAVDLREEARAAVAEYAPLAEERRVALTLAPGPPCPVVADAARLQQVLSNLVSNALRATPAGGRITVEATSRDGGATVRVCDTGVGLAQGEADRLFRPYTQGAGSKGSGLGLYVARGLVAAHGGRIWCESPGKGRGATFAFSIPTAPPGWSGMASAAPGAAQ